MAGTTTFYVYDAFGNLAAEYGPAEPSPCAISGGTGTCYVTSDHLGSTRMLTDTAGTARRRYDFLPFGPQRFRRTSMARTTSLMWGTSPIRTI